MNNGWVQTLVYLGAAALFVPLFKRLGLGSVLGYLVAGIVIGPWVLRIIAENQLVDSVSELGVVLLMFLVGLELNPQRLWAMRKTIFGLGFLQVALTIAVTAALAHWMGEKWPAAVVLGMAACMSSTAIAIQLLHERNLTVAAPGRASFSVALFQDMAVIPILLTLPMLAPGHDPASHAMDWQPIAKGMGLLVGMVVAGRWLLRPLLRWVASVNMREIFVAFAMLLVIGSAMLTKGIGLSMAMGSFVAGLLLADSEYRLELESDIDPFKGLLLGLFFMSVGMSLDLAQLLRMPLVVLLCVAGIVLAKIVVMHVLGFFFGLRRENGLFFALSLSQVGEFAFVILTEGQSLRILAADEAALAKTVVALSMLTTPLLFLLYDSKITPIFQRPEARKPDVIKEKNQVIIAGMGRFGQVQVRLLSALKIPLTVIDNDPQQIETASRFGWRAYYGDASRPDVLEAAGVAKASMVIFATDDSRSTLGIVQYLQKRYPRLKILARAQNYPDALQLAREGIPAVREVQGSALDMCEKALSFLLIDDSVSAHSIVEHFRDYDEDLLQKISAIKADDTQQMLAVYDRERAAFINMLEAERHPEKLEAEMHKEDHQHVPAELAQPDTILGAGVAKSPYTNTVAQDNGRPAL